MDALADQEAMGLFPLPQLPVKPDQEATDRLSPRQTPRRCLYNRTHVTTQFLWQSGGWRGDGPAGASRTAGATGGGRGVSGTPRRRATAQGEGAARLAGALGRSSAVRGRDGREADR